MYNFIADAPRTIKIVGSDGPGNLASCTSIVTHAASLHPTLWYHDDHVYTCIFVNPTIQPAPRQRCRRALPSTSCGATYLVPARALLADTLFIDTSLGVT